MKNQTGKVVIVAGASGGIGKAIAHMAYKAGANVVLAARTVEKLERVAQELDSAGSDRILVAQMDASSPGDARRVVAETMKKWGRVDGVVITAGTWKKLSIDSPVEDALRLARDHFDGLFLPSFIVGFVAQDFMRKQGFGTIFNVSSHAAVRPELEGNLTYGPMKSAGRHFMLSLGHELEGSNVHACDIQPAIVNTPDATGILDTPEKKAAAVQPEEIALWIVDHLDDPNLPEEKKFEAKGGLVV